MEAKNVQAQNLALVGTFFIGYFLIATLDSLQSSFYPSEAKKRGASAYQYGLVFGILNLVGFVVSPLAGVYAPKIGLKKCLCCGFLVTVVSCLLFGHLHHIYNLNHFIGTSYLVRSAMGVSEAVSWTAMIAIMTAMFPDKMSFLMGAMETFSGMGYMLGPVIGSGLYLAGGFQMPFFVIGSLFAVTGLTYFVLIPNQKQQKEKEQATTGSKSLTLSEAVKSFRIMVPIGDLSMCAFCTCMIEAVMEPYLKNTLAASQWQVGSVFGLYGTVYTMASLLSGLVLDRFSESVLAVVSIFANSCMAIGLTLLGPAPFWNLEPRLAFVYGSMVLEGIAWGLVMSSSYTRAYKASLELRFPDDDVTGSVLSGLWSSAFYLGTFVGATSAGAVTDLVGVQWCGAIFGLLGVVNGAINLYYWCLLSKDKFITKDVKYSPIKQCEA